MHIYQSVLIPQLGLKQRTCNKETASECETLKMTSSTPHRSNWKKIQQVFSQISWSHLTHPLSPKADTEIWHPYLWAVYIISWKIYPWTQGSSTEMTGWLICFWQEINPWLLMILTLLQHRPHCCTVSEKIKQLNFYKCLLELYSL